MRKNIGPRMRQLADYVERNPGTIMYKAACAVQPHGRGHCFGYATAWRAVKAGLVRAEPGERRGTYRLYPR
jgi:hypothetical protein